MDHYKNPRNKGIDKNNTEYHTVHLKNPTCGDDVTVAVKISNGVVEDIRHEGIGCSICCSSASVMSETLIEKSVEEANILTNNFYEIVKGEAPNEDLDMGDAISYAGVASFPARIKCATIPWKAFETAVLEINSQK
ncbi:MAG: SUF system NifU family Fe-S cluster assembly protein [Defluviitaleaceae bacterium]|nr:SUF system NifU family Fe-S cluster assembly protein [Defluviitaleaceae bacterium]